MGGGNLLIQHRKQISKELTFNSFEYQIQSKKIINMLIDIIKANRIEQMKDLILQLNKFLSLNMLKC